MKLRLRKPKTDKKVKWSNETVDNENMNKKKSKCKLILELELIAVVYYGIVYCFLCRLLYLSEAA